MSDFPDTWSWSQIFNAGTQPILSLPATPGVVHVITSFAVTFVVSSGNAAYEPVIGVMVAGTWMFRILAFIPTVSASEVFDFGWSGPGKCAGGPGQAVVVQATPNPGIQIASSFTVEGYAV